MREAADRMLAGLGGLGIGAVFFGGLWWTVRQGVTSKRPALLFLGSIVVRMGFALAGFYRVMDHRWERGVACLIGFIAARLAVRKAVERFSGAGPENQTAGKREAENAA